MQRTWNIDEIKNLAESAIAIAPNRDFAAGVFWLAQALNVRFLPWEVDRFAERTPPVQIVQIEQ